MLTKKAKFLGLFILAVSLTIILASCDMGETVETDPTYYDLTIEVDGEGTTEPAPGTYEYEEGTTVDLEVTPEEGWKFDSWDGNVQDSEAAETSILMESNETVTAVFKEEDGETYYISGKIIAEDDSPMANVEVSFTEGYASVFTDGEGYWEKEGLKGELEVSASYEGYAFSPGMIEVDDSEDNVNFVGSQLQEGQEDIVLTKEAKIVPASEADNIEEVSETRNELTSEEVSETRNELTFKERTIFVENLKEGDVLVVNQAVPGAEEGLLKRITERSQDEKTVKVEPAMLDDVIETGDISVTTFISFDHMVEYMQPAEGVRILEVDKQSEKINFEYELTDNATFEGYIGVAADTEIGLESSFSDGIEEFEFYFIPGFETKKSLTAGDSFEWDYDFEIIEIPGPQISIYGPLTITPWISLVVGTEGEIVGEMSTEATYDRTYLAGVYYHEDSGWERILNEEGEDFQLEEPHLEGHGSAGVYAGPDLWGSAGVAYVAEAGLGVNVYGNVQAGGVMQALPWRWRYDIVSFVEAGLFANLRLVRIAEIGWESPTLRFFEKNIAYGASGYVTTDEGRALEGVEIAFESDSFIGSSESSKTSRTGYWSKHLLNDEVIVTPSKEGYYFEPENTTITGPASDIDFTAFLEVDPDDEFTLTMKTEGEGSTLPEEGSHTYDAGESVTIFATPDDFWQFSHWEMVGEEELIETDEQKTSVYMSDDKEVTAVFEATY